MAKRHLFTRSEWVQLFNRAREECLREIKPRPHKTEKGWIVSRPKTELTRCIHNKLESYVRERIAQFGGA